MSAAVAAHVPTDLPTHVVVSPSPYERTPEFETCQPKNARVGASGVSMIGGKRGSKTVIPGERKSPNAVQVHHV